MVAKRKDDRSRTQVDKQKVSLPAYMKQGNRGNEQVGTNDLIIPRLELVQALSPAMRRSDPGFIKGAESGMFNNSVTRKLYGDSVQVCPVYFSVQYLVWRNRKLAETKKLPTTGFWGAYKTMDEAAARCEAEGGAVQCIEVVDTPTHLILVLDNAEGSVEEMMLPMPRTKAKISRAWNTMIRLNGGDRFSRVYTLKSIEATNAKNDAFMNYAIAPETAFAAEGLYKQAEKLYESIRAGQSRTMDVGHMGEDVDPDGGNSRM